MSLRKRMQGLVAAAVVPLAALLVVDAYGNWRNLRQEAENAALVQARLVAGNLASMLDGAHQLALAIGQRAQQGAVDPAGCAAYLQSIAEAVPRYHGAALLNPDGTVKCSTAAVAPGFSLADRPYFQAALKSNALVVGDVVEGRAVGQPSLPLALAIRDPAGRVSGVVLLPVNLAGMASFLGARLSPGRGFALVIDRHGIVAAQVPDHASVVGRSVPADLFRSVKDAAPRVISMIEYRGRQHIVGVSAVDLPPTGLVALVGLDRDTELGPAREALIRSLVVAAAGTGIAIVAAWFVGFRLIERPIRRFLDTAQRHAAGDLKARFPADRAATEFGRLGLALNAMAAAVERLMDQKTLLIREVQHRVMNSLQLLGAFLHLQSRQVTDESALKHLRDARERIVSMSVIYRHLYHGEATSSVEFSGVLRAFCADTGRAYIGGGGSSISVDADPIELPMEVALSLALITHELITNALKHAYSGGSAGPLQVSLRRLDDRLELAVTDEGQGLPAGFDAARTSSLGMAVIQSLTRQLRGKFVAERRAKGTRFAIEFPLPAAPNAA